MSEFNYNRERHLELLKLKSLQELTSVEESELSEYWCQVDGMLYWETREEYIDLLKKLISGEIDSFKFYIKFNERNDSNGNVLDSLEENLLILLPHKKSKKFVYFIGEITAICMSYADIFEYYLSKKEEDSYYLEFRNIMEKIYLEIQKSLNEA